MHDIIKNNEKASDKIGHFKIVTVYLLNNITKTTKKIIALRVRIAFYIIIYFLTFLEIFNMLIIQYLMEYSSISITICLILLYTIHMIL